ncbi:unnamed protein product [Arabidopsis lyrata]|uniref:Predicted protein n=1 Tax=Arabidopsis lyrata subsp. lyrata TaxID=81972 RepID=D7MRY3_ARALL|nr:predicted protein [Arabidopsis lyrata subsp. lyrata]CAH8278091.1 unnamed protein product [Arabidopsis lyrata]
MSLPTVDPVMVKEFVCFPANSIGFLFQLVMGFSGSLGSVIFSQVITLLTCIQIFLFWLSFDRAFRLFLFLCLN